MAKKKFYKYPVISKSGEPFIELGYREHKDKIGKFVQVAFTDESVPIDSAGCRLRGDFWQCPKCGFMHFADLKDLKECRRCGSEKKSETAEEEQVGAEVREDEEE